MIQYGGLKTRSYCVLNKVKGFYLFNLFPNAYNIFKKFFKKSLENKDQGVTIYLPSIFLSFSLIGQNLSIAM